jgi:leucyl-tRNA synthetase
VSCTQHILLLSVLHTLTCVATSRYVLKADPAVRVSARAHKMSKSRGNVVNPDDIVQAYGADVSSHMSLPPRRPDSRHLKSGADSLRLYEMFMGPLRETKVWSTRSVDGVHRFLGRVWRLFEAHASTASQVKPSAEQMRTLHSTIKRVTGAMCIYFLFRPRCGLTIVWRIFDCRGH